MMLEALTQAAGWLLHTKYGFARSMAVLKEARNVKYGTFVAPGNSLRVEIETAKVTESGGTFKASGTVNGQSAVAAKIELAYLNLAATQPELAEIDRRLIEHNKSRWAVLRSVPPVSV
jgi:3-hydroxyacyl-[acyl-carrier-protein] dehydratase